MDNLVFTLNAKKNIFTSRFRYSFNKEPCNSQLNLLLLWKKNELN